MVYVTIDSLLMERYSFDIDISVVGRCPKTRRKALQLVTSIFGELSFSYTDIQDPDLSMLGYLFAELAREKIHLKTIPKNTYLMFLEAKWSKSSEDGPVDIFVDVGSPLRHIYVVEDSPHSNYGRRLGHAWAYDATAVSPWLHETIRIHADFTIATPSCTAAWCTETYIKKVRRLARPRQIYVEPYPGLDAETAELIKRAIGLAWQSKTQ
jgi:hypothetical protein